MQQAEKCPVCKAPWPGDKFVGERAITSTEQSVQARRRSHNRPRESGTGSSLQNVDGADDSEDEPNDAAG
jgi:RNA polymerase subunit RPABC4/transcription elongation factor Spt4